MRSHTGFQFQTSVVAAGGIKGFPEIAPGPCGCACAEGSSGFGVSPAILGLCPFRLQHLWEHVVVSCLSTPWFLSKINRSTQGDGALCFMSQDGAELHTKQVCSGTRCLGLHCCYAALLLSGVFGCSVKCWGSLLRGGLIYLRNKPHDLFSTS